MKVYERIMLFLELKGYTTNAFAQMSGIDPGNMRKMLASKQRITDATLRKISNAHGLEFDWLKCGEGEMLRSPDNPTYIISGDGNIVQGNNNKKNRGSIETNMTNYFNEGQNRQKYAIEETPTAKISYTTGRPYYNVDFIEGFDLVTNDQTINPEYYIDFAPYNKDGVVWCNITGNSMEPLISNGDIIALKPLQDWNSFIEYGKTYAIVTTNNIRTVKKIRKGSDKDHLLLIPENLKECDEQEIHKSMIKYIFLVIGCMKKL